MATIAPTPLSSILESARQLANMERSQVVTDPELTRWVNLGLAELYGLLLTSYGDDYFSAQGNLALVANQDTYALPADLLKLRAVDLLVQAAPAAYVDLDRVNFADRNRFSTSPSLWTSPAALGISKPVYYLLGNNIVLLPVPGAAGTVRLTYVPRAPVLAGAVDTWDGYNGWEEYGVLYAATRVLQKEESDVSVLLAQLSAFRQRVVEESHGRDVSQPSRVVDAGGGDW